MEHEFSWRKVIEATVIVLVVYLLVSPLAGLDTSPFGIVKNIGLFAVLYAATSKLLEKVSEEE